MSSTGRGSPLVVAISVSESPDMRLFGQSDGHLRDAMKYLAHYPLERGDDLAYGGDLRSNGFTEFLCDTALDYRRSGGPSARVTNYLAWPVHIGLDPADLRDIENRWRGTARLELLDEEGQRLSLDERAVRSRRTPDEREWARGLTAMREVMRAESSVRLVLGGRVEGYLGRMPGVAEEALMSLRHHQPVFLVGGFGGCARALAETLGLAPRWSGSLAWSDQPLFQNYCGGDLRNGLSLEENRILATTPHLDEMVPLFMRGLHRLRTDRSRTAADTETQDDA